MLDLLLFAEPASLWPTIFAGWFGLMVGSFLNVVIHRKPKMMIREWENEIAEYRKEPIPHTDKYTLAVPRSACPHCGHKITAIENIPLISYFLLLRGKCSECKAPISLRYPMVEALTGILTAVIIWHFGSGWTGLAAMVFGFLLIAMTFIDFDTTFLPDDLTYPLLWLGLLLNVTGAFATLQDAIIGAVAGYMLLWSINAAHVLLRGIDGMGRGDFILLAALGAWFGWQTLPIVILLSSVVALVAAVFGMLFKKRDKFHKIPFGPYLAGAGLVSLFYGKLLVAALFQYMQP